MPRFRISIRTRARRSRDKTRARARRRVGLRLLVVAAVLGVAVGVYLDVSLKRRFDGRLWMLPSRIYSDVLVLRPGDALESSDVVRRLRRSGYARTPGSPDRPGQYRIDGATLDLHLRAFEAAGVEEPARRLRLAFGGGRLRRITNATDRWVGRAVLEPELLATLYGPRQEERHPVPLQRVPERLQNAVLAAEDARFASHHGLDLRGILRASWANLRRGQIVQGGSTITQQTVKNIFLDQRRTWWRKAREGVLSVLLDAHYSKDRIFEVYLNEVYLGQRGPVAICGVQAAARFYFGRDLGDLSLGESALLAGMIRSPGRFNPFADRERALARRGQVLGAMVSLGMVTPEQAEAAGRERLQLASGASGFPSASHAVDFVRGQLGELVSPETLRWEGLSIYTTLDTMWQSRAEEALREGLDRLERRPGRPKRDEGLEGAVLVLEPSSGAILAMVGGRDYASSQFNRASQARRQPGSCFKPFVYAAGFERASRGESNGLTPATTLDDSPFEMVSGGETWRPANYDGEFRGWVTVRDALVQSLNVPTVRAARRVGLDHVIATSRRMGIVSPLKEVPSIALGAMEVTPLELAAGYATLARQGRYGKPWIIREIVAPDESTLARPGVEWSQAITPQAAYQVNDLLRGVLIDGTGRSAAALGYRGVASAKTGTTDDTRDAWFAAYSNELLSLVWVGYDDGAPTGLTGASGALPIWVDLMRRAGASDRRAHENVPEGMVSRRVDPETGGLYVRGCPRWVDEVFVRGTEPQRPCLRHGGRFRRWFHRLRGEPPYAAREGV